MKPCFSDLMQEMAAPIGADAARISAGRRSDAARGFTAGELALGHDLSSPRGARAYADMLVERAVMATQMDAGTLEAAIHSLSRRYRLGSFIRKLWKGEACSLHLDKIVRLERAHDDALRALRNRLGGHVMRCQCCGQEVQFDLEAAMVAGRLTPLECVILRIIDKADGFWLTAQQIADAVYADRADGGPDWARSNVIERIHAIRKKLSTTGIEIEGRTHCGYRLVWLPRVEVVV